jgi:integrase
VVVKLNAKMIERLKPVAGKRMAYHDTMVRGLTLRITERGAKSWSVLYYHRLRLRSLTLGSVDAIGLADARERAREVLRRASKGNDPASEKKADRQAETMTDLAHDFIERYAKRKKKSWRKDEWMVRSKVLPKWGNRAVKDITRRDVRRLVEELAADGAPILANRLCALLSKLFRFALDDELISASPAHAIARPAPERERDRVLSEKELRQLWKEFDSLPSAMAAYFKLRLVLAQRGAEVASMQWADLDIAGGWWTIPSTQSKNKLSHRVPLSPMALNILKGLKTQGPADEFVLAGARGKRQQSEAAAEFTVKDFRGHDLRRTAATFMTRGGIPRSTVGKILNHVETGVTKVYDRNSYDAEKSAALAWWSARLTGILAGDKAASVLPFARG